MLDKMVDIAGVLGFVLSGILAISGIISNRLRLSVGEVILIDAGRKAPNSVFLFFTITNKIRVPFSLIGTEFRDKSRKTYVPFEKTVRTYAQRATDKRLAVRPVVLSRAFPVRFEPYDAQVFLLELSRQHIDMRLLRPDAPTHSPAGHPRIQRWKHKLCTRLLPLRLVLNTSRGRREVPISVSETRSWDYLEKYAVQKAGYEEKIVFPE